MKNAVRSLLTHPFAVRAASALARGDAPIFMLHRFRDADAGIDGHDPGVLRANLAWLRANGYRPLPLMELLDRLEARAPVRNTVAFTVDDGYSEFSRIAAPIFSEFDCPVTVFLTTGFLDGSGWLWWDQLSLALASLGRSGTVAATTEALKLVPEADRLGRIRALLNEARLELPATPPSRFAPLTWDDARRLGRGGNVTFGPHSVTHPLLARTGDDQSRAEIHESWRRVRTETDDAAIPVFCYPNGLRGDFGPRETATIAAAGLRAAVSATPGFVNHRDLSEDHAAARYRLPRFGYSDDRPAFMQQAGRIERLKMAMRAAIHRDGP